MSKKILFIEICNYDDYPLGGHLSFAKNLLQGMGDQLALVGCSTDEETPIGKWTKKEINGIEYDYFSVRKVNSKSFRKPIVPARLKHYFAVRKYRKQIFEYPTENVFIQTAEVLFATSKYFSQKNVAFIFPGVGNILSISRYFYAKKLAGIYESLLFNTLQKVKAVFACADHNAIEALCARSDSRLLPENVVQYPTRVDPQYFYFSGNKEEYRKKLNLKTEETIVITSGRLHWAKGWKFMIDAFEIFLKTNPEAHFFFIGDGNEKDTIQSYIDGKNLSERITLKGNVNHQTLADYLRAGDLYIMGSLEEGFSTSLVEAVACGIPACVTLFSSAKELVQDGFNGYVCLDRNEANFTQLMEKSLNIPLDNLIESSETAKKYSICNMKEDLLDNWKLM